MMLDDFLNDYLDDEAFGEANLAFWVRTVMEAMTHLGPETDANLERFCGMLLKVIIYLTHHRQNH